MDYYTCLPLHSIMPRAGVNGTSCSRSADRLETDRGRVREVLKVDQWRGKKEKRKELALPFGRFCVHGRRNNTRRQMILSCKQ